MKAFSTAVCAVGAMFGLAVSALAETYVWTSAGTSIGSTTYVKIFDDVGALNGRLRLVGFSTADGEYTVTSNRVHVLESTGGTANGLPTASYTYQMSAGARYDGTATKSIRVQLAQPVNSYALYARITAVATANGDHTDEPDLRVAINEDHTVEGATSIEAADLLANAVTKIVVASANETIAYWPFGTNGFHDVSGNGHDLEGVEVSESEAAYMSLNDGRTDQYLKTASALDLSKETAVTFECWCRQTEHLAKTYNIAFASANPTVGTGGFVLYNSGVYQAQMHAASDGWQLDNTDTIKNDFVDGMWHHVAYVVDRSRTDHYSCRLYVDGVLQHHGGATGSATYMVPELFNDFFMIGGGADYVSGSNYYRGYIDDVRISRGVVAPEDFLKYPTVGKTMRADDGKLPVVAYWPFGGKYGRDATGNGFDLTMSENVVLNSEGCAATAWATRTAQFECSPGQTFPFSAFSKTGVTIEMYVKANSSSKVLGMMLESSLAYWGSQGSFRFNYDANSSGYRTVSVAFRTPAGAAGSKTTEETFGNIGDNTWRHIAAVYDPSKTGAGIVTLYVDGVPGTCTSDDAGQTAFALGDLPLYFFRRANKQISDGTTEGQAVPYYGSLDDVRITAAALTPDQFLPHRSAGSTIALYRFDKGSLADVSGCGNELIHCQNANMDSGIPSFGLGDYPESGTGLLLSGKSGTKDWLRTANPVDFTGTKAFTVEIDYNSTGNPAKTDNCTVHVLCASTNATVVGGGGFVVYRNGDLIFGQFAKTTASTWLSSGLNVTTPDMATACPNGYRRCRYVINANTAGSVVPTLYVDGTAKTHTKSATYSSLGSLVLSFGHSPSYYGYKDTEPCFLTGKILRIAVSDSALDSSDYVLDNLVMDETKRTLAYWDFSNLDGLTVSDGGVRGGGLVLGGSTSVTTTNLTLSALTQATVECFVRFGATPASGALFSLGSGAGSFAVASDATAGTLAGTFIPYDHLAASNGGTAELAPLAGREWHHVALVIDRTKSGADAVRFYVDYERALPAGRAWDKSATILDGALTVGTGFTGRIDDVRVSAGALEPGEFLQSRTGGPDGMSISIR